MNPLSNVRFIKELNEKEIRLGISEKNSWHNEYKDSAWIFAGGLPYALTEGDILCVFSQYGEIVNINLVRDKATGRSKGYCFICYEDQRSTVLAVDNFNGIKILNRIIRVDHVANYRLPKDRPEDDDVTKNLRDKGCAPRISPSPEKETKYITAKLIKKEKKEKKKKKKKSKDFSNDNHDGYSKHKRSSSDDSPPSLRHAKKELSKASVGSKRETRWHSKSPTPATLMNRISQPSRKRSLSPDTRGYYSPSEKHKIHPDAARH